MSEALYRRVPHACRTCMGPVLSHDTGFVCAVCDAASTEVVAICGCGIESADYRRDLGFRCAPNPNRSAQSPAAVVILFGQTQKTSAESEIVD